MTSQEALDLLRNYEKFSPTVYPDKGGVATIGYGMTKNEFPGLTLQSTNILTEPQAKKLLEDKIENKFIPRVKELVSTPLTTNQLGALASFMYNVGEPNFTSSTLRKKLNSGDFEGALMEFPRWNKVRNKDTGKLEPAQGLTDRREAEMALFRGDMQGLGKKLEEKKFGTPGYAAGFLSKKGSVVKSSGGSR